ncbi:DEKNAAC100508 [Brettanomyces naardenensis]|uniref:DEKNAAC100508 n=1 Tax=Brettanomyces naardenensis TaxID=13370 RepID=A0A448YFN2_BRENA|nr:DEKNAAC100508 [Brettanomyces naardenensis]
MVSLQGRDGAQSGGQPDGHDSIEGIKEDHRALNQYFHSIQQYTAEVDGTPSEFSVLDLSGLNGEFQIDPSLAENQNNREHNENISAAAAAVAAYQQQRQDNAKKVAETEQPGKRSSGDSRREHELPDKSFPESQEPKMLTPEEAAKLLPVPAGVDPKKMCRFCGRTFAYPGSLGRHLDLRKGAPKHPASIIEKLRAHVARRGNEVEVKTRRKLRAKEYNRREYVRAKNRERRRLTNKVYRARDIAQMKFYRSIGTPVLDEDASFPRIVLFFLPASLWPEEPPTEETLRLVISWMDQSESVRSKCDLLVKGLTLDSYSEILKRAYDSWTTESEVKRQSIWVRELRQCAQDALGSLTLFDFATREAYAMRLSEQKRIEMLQEGKRQELKGPNSNKRDAANQGDLISSGDNNDSDTGKDVTTLQEDELVAVAAAAEAAVKRGYDNEQ